MPLPCVSAPLRMMRKVSRWLPSPLPPPLLSHACKGFLLAFAVFSGVYIEGVFEFLGAPLFEVVSSQCQKSLHRRARHGARFSKKKKSLRCSALFPYPL